MFVAVALPAPALKCWVVRTMYENFLVHRWKNL